MYEMRIGIQIVQSRKPITEVRVQDVNMTEPRPTEIGYIILADADTKNPFIMVFSLFLSPDDEKALI